MRYIIETTKTDAGTRKIPITEDVADMFRAIIEDRELPKTEKVIDGYTGFLFYDDDGNPLAMHWQHRFNHMVGRYNDIYWGADAEHHSACLPPHLLQQSSQSWDES